MNHLLRRPAIVLGLALLGAALPSASWAQAGACTIASSSRLESVINQADGEDEDFIGAKTRALPQIAWLLDTSGHMRKFPIDLTDPNIRLEGTGCNNVILDGLEYSANPCIDGIGNPVNPTPNTCSGTPRFPDGYGLPYMKDALGGVVGGRVYPAYDSRVPGLFDPAKWYVHDNGWSQGGNAVTLANGVDWANLTTAAMACTAAYPTDLVEQAACNACFIAPEKGYYLPANPLAAPVLKGNWINFYPPKYVIARKVLTDQFVALTTPVRIRQAMVTLEDAHPDNCYSENLGNTGFDLNAGFYRDGARRVGGGGNTDFKPPCLNVGCTGGSGGGVPGFLNAVYNHNRLFTSPQTVAPVIAVPPSEMPAGWLLSFFQRLDGSLDGQFTNPLDPDPLTNTKKAFCAPYAEAVLNTATYMSEYSVLDANFNFADGVLPTLRWEKPGWTGPEICPASSCQCSRPTIILIAGGDPGFDDNLPCEITGKECPVLPGLGGTGTVACGDIPGQAGNLARMTQYLATRHLRPSGGFPVGRQISISTYIVGFGTNSPSLVAAAAAGNGEFLIANNASQLKSAINEALQRINIAELSFSNANISAVQSRTAQALIVPRFTPSKKAFWKGRLSLYNLVSEQVCGCPVSPVTGCPAAPTADYDNDTKCDGVFFTDSSGAWIGASPDGIFRRVSGPGAAAAITDPVATPVWDAADRLNCASMPAPLYCSASTGAPNSRRIMTSIDSNNDGLFDYRDDVISFDTQPANVAAILPYMNLGSDFCALLSSKLGTCLNPTQCATAVIEYVRGRDLLDENCDGSTTDERPQKLGDIFHSSPVMVDPPLSAGSQIGIRGLHNQFLVSLTSTPTPMDPVLRYSDFHTLWKFRRKLLLVGANDGMLHAFNGGDWDAVQQKYTLGTGDELWAFIPPDLLPKLHRLMDGSKHQFFVDGTAMVREIWADEAGPFVKSASEFHTLAVMGERRGGNSFFALDITRPEGPPTLPYPGCPAAGGANCGFFRWVYPQPNTVPQRLAGQSYSDYLPTPPPIGPVRLKNDTSPLLYQGVPYEERWIVLLNGGNDIQGLRGRMISMIDAWWGGGGRPNRQDRPLWAFVPGKGPVNFSNASDFELEDEDEGNGYSIAATPGMVGFGANTTNISQSQNDYFFDTATVGDTGGNLWAFRFNHPDSNNWSGGRVMQTYSGDTCSRQPFYQVTANVISNEGGYLRTLIGSGDRFSFRDRMGGECSSTNLMACVRRGCRLKIETTTKVCGEESKYKREFTAGGPTTCDDDQKIDIEVNARANCCTEDIEAKVKYELRCTDSLGVNQTIRWEPEFRCEPTTSTICGVPTNSYACRARNDVPLDICQAYDLCDSYTIEPSVPRGAFYSVKVFKDSDPARAIFNTRGGASTYDNNLITPSTAITATSGLVKVQPYDNVATTQATTAQDGWWFPYAKPPGWSRVDTSGAVVGAVAEGGAPVAMTGTRIYPTDPNTGTEFLGSPVNERTASQPAVVGGCAFWSTFTPASTQNVCGTSAIGLHTTYHLNHATGYTCTGPLLDAALASTRLSSTLDTLPPPPPVMTIFVSPDGTITPSVTTVPRGAGGRAPTTAVASGNEVISDSYILEVSRGDHACRHQLDPIMATNRTNAQNNCPVR